MKNNQGFIATSLLYSFFLVFCALLLSLVGTFMHNQVLLSSVMDNIKTDLSEAGKKTVSTIEVGNYVKIPLFSTGVKINTDSINWIVVKRDDTAKTLTLVSDNIVVMSNDYRNLSLLQQDLNRFFNLYTTGTVASNYITYLTRADITSFENISNLTVRKAALAVNSEYFYYDSTTSGFYLYKYECDPNDNCAPKTPVKIQPTDTKQYGLRYVMKVSYNTPIASGIGVLNEPYEVLYYIHKNETGNSLKLHYDNINYSGNLGFKTADNYFTDLSGNNPRGILNTVTYTNDINNGMTIPATRTINTNLNIYSIITGTTGYTIEFRVKNYLRLSSYPNYLNNFVLLTNNSTLTLSTSNYSTGKASGTFNTFSIVKRPASPYLEVYINGEKMGASVTVTNLPSVVNNILYVGGSSYAEIIKSIRVYNTALTELEIRHNYNVDERWRIS